MNVNDFFEMFVRALNEFDVHACYEKIQHS